MAKRRSKRRLAERAKQVEMHPFESKMDWTVLKYYNVGIFLIGMAIIYWTNTVWPGVLVLLGLIAILDGLFRHKKRKSMQS